MEKWGIRPSRLTILGLCQDKIRSLVRYWWVALETLDIWRFEGVSYEYKPFNYFWTPNGEIGHNHPLRAGVCWSTVEMSRMDMFLTYYKKGYLNPGSKVSIEKDSKRYLLCPLWSLGLGPDDVGSNPRIELTAFKQRSLGFGSDDVGSSLR